MGSTVFIIPSDVIKSSGYRPQILYTSSDILNPVDPLASAYNLYISMRARGAERTLRISQPWQQGERGVRLTKWRGNQL